MPRDPKLSDLVLGILAARPMYGYEVVHRADERTRGCFAWREGTVYPLLHRLEREGLLRSEWRDSPGRKRRKYYSVTRRGKARLAEARRNWREWAITVALLLGGPDAHPA